MEFKLIIKKLNNNLSKEEGIIFAKWYNESNQHRHYFKNVKANYQNDPFQVDIEKGWLELERKINPIKLKNNYWKYAVAASVILLIAASVVFNQLNKDSIVAEPIIVNNNIKSGSDKATLTLEDGSVITLEKGQNYVDDNLNSNGEDLVYKANDVKTEITYNYLTIPRGGQFHLILSDETEVWLNSETQLKYPVNFIEGETRQVELVYGEAYFDVSPSTEHKGSRFKVFNQSQEVEVLGTEFNIKAYKDELKIFTTLVEGKVSVDGHGKKHYLVPNQQSVLNINNNVIDINKVNVYNEVSWKDGVFIFKNKSLNEIMKVLSRWYDTDFVFEDKEMANITFNGKLYKNQSIEEILNFININNYKINNKIIIFK